MRKIMRRIAHVKMEKAGWKHINKRGPDGKSRFSRFWRRWV